MSYLQCPRRLWLEVHRRYLAAEDPARLARFEAGHRVGAIARTLYAQAAVQSGRSVEFETQYVHDHVLIRADIIERGGLFDFGPSTTRLVEVKSSSKVAQAHIRDSGKAPVWHDLLARYWQIVPINPILRPKQMLIVPKRVIYRAKTGT